MEKQAFNLVYISPVPRVSVQGWDRVSYYTYKKGTNEVVSSSKTGTTKSFGRDGAAHETFMFPIDYNSMKVVTGLSVMIDNPIYKLDVPTIRKTYKLGGDWTDEKLKSLSKSPTIKKQTYYEIKHNVRPEYYTDEVKGGTIFDTKGDLSHLKGNADYRPNFLQKFKYTFYDRPNRITDETPRGDLAMLLANIHPIVSKAKADINTALHRWYISEENEAELERVNRQDTIHKAIARLVNLKEKHTDLTKLKVATLLRTTKGDNLVKGEVSNSTVVDRLNNFISREGSSQMANVREFDKVMSLLESGKVGKNKIDIQYMIETAIHNNIMSNIDGWYVWHSKSGIPNMYKITTDYDKLCNLFLAEKEKYNPDAKDITNWYKDLYDELTLKGVKLN